MGRFERGRAETRATRAFLSTIPFSPVSLARSRAQSTYCETMKTHCDNLQRSVHVVNLDPAAESFGYPASIDVRDLITVADAMEELDLGPNGALMYCMEYLEENLDEWLGEALEGYGDDDYLLFDCPGQAELYAGPGPMTALCDWLRNDGWNVAAVYCLDAAFCGDAGKYVAGCLSALAAMVALEAPHINVLTKCDLIQDKERLEELLIPDAMALQADLDAQARGEEAEEEEEMEEAKRERERAGGAGSGVADDGRGAGGTAQQGEGKGAGETAERAENADADRTTDHAENAASDRTTDHAEDADASAPPLASTVEDASGVFPRPPFSSLAARRDALASSPSAAPGGDRRHPRKSRAALNAALASLLESYGTVGFVALDPTDEDSVRNVLVEIDTCIQYGEDQDIKGTEYGEFPDQDGEGGDDDY